MGINVTFDDPTMFTNVYWKIQNCHKRFVVSYGGAGCFRGDQLVVTDGESKPISEIKTGDMVLTRNHDTNVEEFKPVLKPIKQTKEFKRLIEIRMKDGSIIRVTPSHEFYYGGAYVKVIDLLLSLANDRMETNTRIYKV